MANNVRIFLYCMQYLHIYEKNINAKKNIFLNFMQQHISVTCKKEKFLEFCLAVSSTILWICCASIINSSESIDHYLRQLIHCFINQKCSTLLGQYSYYSRCHYDWTSKGIALKHCVTLQVSTTFGCVEPQRRVYRKKVEHNTIHELSVAQDKLRRAVWLFYEAKLFRGKTKTSRAMHRQKELRRVFLYWSTGAIGWQCQRRALANNRIARSPADTSWKGRQFLKREKNMWESCLFSIISYPWWPDEFIFTYRLKGGVQRDRSGRMWYQSIGLALTKRRPDFQLNPSIPQGARAL